MPPYMTEKVIQLYPCQLLICQTSAGIWSGPGDLRCFMSKSDSRNFSSVRSSSSAQTFSGSASSSSLAFSNSVVEIFFSRNFCHIAHNSVLSKIILSSLFFVGCVISEKFLVAPVSALTALYNRSRVTLRIRFFYLLNAPSLPPIAYNHLLQL